MTTTVDEMGTVEVTAARFSRPIGWVRLHHGRHRCVDNKWYTYSCLVTDPTCEQVALSYMRMARCVSLGRPDDCVASCLRVWCRVEHVHLIRAAF